LLHSDARAALALEAHGKAAVQSQQFWGRADVIKYDPRKELVVLEAEEGNVATLHPARLPHTAPEAPTERQGKRIYYFWRTGFYKIEGVVEAAQDRSRDERSAEAGAGTRELRLRRAIDWRQQAVKTAESMDAVRTPEERSRLQAFRANLLAK